MPGPALVEGGVASRNLRCPRYPQSLCYWLGDSAVLCRVAPAGSPLVIWLAVVVGVGFATLCADVCFMHGGNITLML